MHGASFLARQSTMRDGFNSTKERGRSLLEIARIIVMIYIVEKMSHCFVSTYNLKVKWRREINLDILYTVIMTPILAF